jgi:hypothetical protein
MNLALWLEVLISRRNLLRERLLFIVELSDELKAHMIQRFVCPQHILL